MGYQPENDEPNRLPVEQASHTPANNDSESYLGVGEIQQITDETAIAEARELHRQQVEALFKEAIEAVKNEGWQFDANHFWALRISLERSLPLLLSTMNDSLVAASIRVRAATVLHRLGEVAGEQYLLDSLTSESVDLRFCSVKQFWNECREAETGGRAKLLLSMISDPDERTRMMAIKVCATRRLPGTEDRLVSVLQNREVIDLAEAACYLALVATKPKTVEVILEHIFTREKYNPSVCSFLRGVLESSNPDMSMRARKAAHDYVRRHRFEQRYEQQVARNLGITATREAVPLLEDISCNAQDSVSRHWALEGIAQAMPEVAVDLALQHLSESPSSTWTAIQMMSGRVKNEDVSRVLRVLLKNPTVLRVDEMRFVLSELGEEGRLALKNLLGKMHYFNKMWAAWKLKSLRLRDALDDLAAAGVISEAPDAIVARLNEVRRRRAEPNVDETEASELLAALKEAGVLVRFVCKTGELPVAHHRLVSKFANATKGLFSVESPSQIWHSLDDGSIDYGDEDEYKSPHYVVQFIHDGKLYRFRADQYRSYYDREAIEEVLNLSLLESGHEEQFIRLYGDGELIYYVFAKPDVFGPIAEKYYLT